MSLVIDLPAAQETRLQERRIEQASPSTSLVYQAIAEKFPVEMDENAQALRLIEQWIAEAPYGPRPGKGSPGRPALVSAVPEPDPHRSRGAPCVPWRGMSRTIFWTPARSES
jgi:hypothetical protein